MKVGGIYEITPISNFYEAVIVEELHAGCQATGFMFSIYNKSFFKKWLDVVLYTIFRFWSIFHRLVM